jgi:hypothetical protein
VVLADRTNTWRLYHPGRHHLVCGAEAPTGATATAATDTRGISR